MGIHLLASTRTLYSPPITRANTPWETTRRYSLLRSASSYSSTSYLEQSYLFCLFHRLPLWSVIKTPRSSRTAAPVSPLKSLPVYVTIAHKQYGGPIFSFLSESLRSTHSLFASKDFVLIIVRLLEDDGPTTIVVNLRTSTPHWTSFSTRSSFLRFFFLLLIPFTSFFCFSIIVTHRRSLIPGFCWNWALCDIWLIPIMQSVQTLAQHQTFTSSLKPSVSCEQCPKHPSWVFSLSGIWKKNPFSFEVPVPWLEAHLSLHCFFLSLPALLLYNQHTLLHWTKRSSQMLLFRFSIQNGRMKRAKKERKRRLSSVFIFPPSRFITEYLSISIRTSFVSMITIFTSTSPRIVVVGNVCSVWDVFILLSSTRARWSSTSTLFRISP